MSHVLFITHYNQRYAEIEIEIHLPRRYNTHEASPRRIYLKKDIETWRHIDIFIDHYSHLYT